jgi:hypothetical protein
MSGCGPVAHATQVAAEQVLAEGMTFSSRPVIATLLPLPGHGVVSAIQRSRLWAMATSNSTLSAFSSPRTRKRSRQ